MAVSPVNIVRVSQNARTEFVLDSLRRTQRDLFLTQARLATGRSFVTASEDPIRAARTVDLTRALAQQDQFMANLQHGDNFLTAADTALVEVNDLITQASVIASQMVGDLTTADERQAEAEVVASIRQQLQIVGNRLFSGRYIFAGRSTLEQPFVDGPGGIRYVGDIGEMLTRIGEGLAAPINMPGNEVFGALSNTIATDKILTPVLTSSTRLDEITGAAGADIRKGTLVFNEVGGAGIFTVDLSNADTIGDVVDLINEAATANGAGVNASLGDTGLIIDTATGAVSITDTSTGVVAADLGILNNAPVTGTLVGEALVPRITRLTPIDTLAGGTGIDLTGLVITNGTRTETVDLSTAETVQDIINAINNAGVFVLARINDDGTRIDVFNQVSGSSLGIGENGGTTAADLGIRTFDAATPLDQLNFGRGVTFADGEADLQITMKDGSTLDVTLDGAVTIGDVIDRINEAAGLAGVNVTASFAQTGNGIQLVDGTTGAGALSVSMLNLSPAVMDLGLTEPVLNDGTTLVGVDVNPMQTDGVLDALIELENALRADDTRGVSLAGGRLDDLRIEVTRVHGVIGARSHSMQAKTEQMRDAAATTEIFLSQTRDLDYAEAVTRMQAALTQFQANLQTSASLLGLSLLDFLR